VQRLNIGVHSSGCLQEREGRTGDSIGASIVPVITGSSIGAGVRPRQCFNGIKFFCFFFQAEPNPRSPSAPRGCAFVLTAANTEEQIRRHRVGSA